MQASVEYINLHNSLVLLRIFKGPVSIDDLLSSWQHIIDKQLINDNHRGVATDYSDAELLFKHEDVETFSDYVLSNKDFFKKLKIAQVMVTHHLALGVLYELKSIPRTSKTFSTLDAAINWILLQ